MGLLGGPLKITQQSESQVSEDLISATTSATSCRKLPDPAAAPGRYFMGSSRGRAQQGVTEEALITVGVAAMLVIIIRRSWSGGELETGRRLQGYGVSSLRWVDNGKRESS